MFHARDKIYLDMGLGSPKGHVVCFVLNSEAFGPKTAPPILYVCIVVKNFLLDDYMCIHKSL